MQTEITCLTHDLNDEKLEHLTVKKEIDQLKRDVTDATSKKSQTTSMECLQHLNTNLEEEFTRIRADLKVESATNAYSLNACQTRAKVNGIRRELTVLKLKAKNII
jgi:23S rRNA maturation mini-RNase III